MTVSQICLLSQVGGEELSVTSAGLQRHEVLTQIDN